MTIQKTTATKLLAETSQLLEDMILELELRGCEAHHELVKRAVAMQAKIETLKEN